MANSYDDDQLNLLNMLFFLQQNGSLNVVSLKLQGMKCKDGLIKEKDFILGFYISYQYKCMEKYASRQVLIDSTHITNRYNFILTTFFGIDENTRALPILYCVSNSDKSSIITKFLFNYKNKTKKGYKIQCS